MLPTAEHPLAGAFRAAKCSLLPKPYRPSDARFSLDVAPKFHLVTFFRGVGKFDVLSYSGWQIAYSWLYGLLPKLANCTFYYIHTNSLGDFFRLDLA